MALVTEMELCFDECIDGILNCTVFLGLYEIM